MLKKWLIGTLSIVLFLITIYALRAQSTLPIFVKALDSSGNIQPNTLFNYTFNFSTDSSCTNILLSNVTQITTRSDGTGFLNLSISSLGSTTPSFICEYRNGNLRAVHFLSDQLFNIIRAAEIKLFGNLTVDTGK